ncbi:MAG TPA: GRP family sugar transporter [Puia sp.]
MFIIESYPLAVFFCIITMFCWGSWANTQKLAASSWRFELFYWDYVIGIFLLGLIFAITLGNSGSEGRSFMDDLKQAGETNILSAVTGGIIFNAANILLCAAIAIAGMSVAFPVGIGLALVIGVVVNYIDHPLGNKVLLFGGVALIVIAILLNAFAYRKMQSGNKNPSSKGLILSIISGVLMGLFYKYVAASMFPDFTIPEAGKLSPYTAVVFFSLGILVSNFLFNTILMRRPFAGTPVSYKDYFSGGFKNHITGILGGIIWCIGMSFSIIASGKAGPAISYGLGQGATVVAAIWGIYVWKEFKGVKGVQALLSTMLLCYIIGLMLIILSH